jgi:hypothetical protein
MIIIINSCMFVQHLKELLTVSEILYLAISFDSMCVDVMWRKELILHMFEVTPF